MSDEGDTEASSELDTSEEEDEEENGDEEEEEEVPKLELPNRATRGRRLNKVGIPILTLVNVPCEAELSRLLCCCLQRSSVGCPFMPPGTPFCYKRFGR